MIKKLSFIAALVIAAFLFYAAPAVHAATMSFVSSETSAVMGDTVNVSVRIDSQGQTTNAAQATIQYPVNILQVVTVDHSNSIFNIWAKEPSINTSTGEISFLGGGTNAFSGTSLYILNLTFAVKGTGLATLNFVNAGVTAGDGTGSNILDGTTPLSINVGGVGTISNATTTPALPNTGLPAEASTTVPVAVTRAPVAATGLPAAPVLSVPLYPDPSRWYNLLGDTIVLWNVPADVTAVATNVSHIESTAIGTPQTTLSNGQDFGTLADGIWYVTARFKNNVGWGPPAYYKISIDTAPPLPFTVQVQNAGTDDPSPTLQFGTSDSLSGIAYYTATVDGTVIATTTATAMILPPQKPGAHTLVVSASDLAGNSVQSAASFTILPLPTPQIIFVEPSVVQGNFIFVSGNSAPSSSVAVRAVDASNREVFTGTAVADSAGHWDATINVPLAVGTYSLSATAHDDHGAQSLASAPASFDVRAASVLSFGGIELGWLEILIIVILLAITGISLWSWSDIAKKQKRGLYNTVASRDIEKLTDILLANLKDFADIPAVKNAADDPELTHAIETMSGNIGKMKKYIKQELEKLK